MDNMSLSDIAAVTRGNDNDGWGQGGAWWLIILFLFVFMGGNGGLWGNRTGEYGQYATAASQQEILYGQQFGQLNDRLTNFSSLSSLGVGFSFCSGSSPFSSSTVTPKAFAMGPSIFSGISRLFASISDR